MSVAVPSGSQVEALSAYALEIPTDAPESDGTAEWTETTIVIVLARVGDLRGVGYSYADPLMADLVQARLAPLVLGTDALSPGTALREMLAAVRNVGRRGMASHAISAVDVALWDLKARLLGLPLVDLLGRARDHIDAYGSGGFTSYGMEQLREQLGGWAAAGMSRVKMKVGRVPAGDAERVRVAREAIGDGVELFVDANGAYKTPSAALAQAHRFHEHGVTWFEEPVSSDDLAGLAAVRRAAPPGMAIAAGEYAYGPEDHQLLLEREAVDVVQADATRCLGVSGFLAAGALCRAHGRPLSAHTAPSLHTHLGCAVEAAVHVEWFHDHARVERMVFDGAPQPIDGRLAPDAGRPGLGLEPIDEEIQRWAA
jgi:L-alanine-DL-glutamate epimerase-like enolase superfamily enzyme